MKVINIQEAKTHLSRLVEEVISGEEIIVGKAGKPLVRLVPYSVAQSPRVGGQYAGRIIEAEDCWAPDDDPFEGALDAPVLYCSVAASSPKVADEGVST